ncbi:MAG: histidinol-phosphate transaminase [Planctomycetes bacterium]|nr:histidinol-phosphate transaminase [Planctomycetota bacterium]
MNLFRREIEAMSGYSLPQPAAAIKVDLNEAPWDWPDELKEEAARLLKEVPFHRYPQEGAKLTEALARRWNLPESCVLTGNGSNELLQAVCLAALEPGRKLMMPVPTFSVYRQIAAVCGTHVTEIPLQDGVAYRPEEWIAAIRRERPNVVLICSPNNPTGAEFPASALREVLDAAPGLVVVDEAYAEFTDATARKWLPEADRLVVLRTLSKAWAAAGLRLGYLLAAPSATPQIRKALLPFRMNSITARLGLLALRHAPLFEQRIRKIVSERERLYAELASLPGVIAYPSHANFILIRVTAGVAGALLERGILVRDISDLPGLKGCVRITVGTPEENDAVLAALREVVS